MEGEGEGCVRDGRKNVLGTLICLLECTEVKTMSSWQDGTEMLISRGG